MKLSTLLHLLKDYDTSVEVSLLESNGEFSENKLITGLSFKEEMDSTSKFYTKLYILYKDTNTTNIVI